MKLMNKIRKLLGVRSPSLEPFGYYSCGNCQHAELDCICVVCEEDDNMLYCPKQHKHMSKHDTCKRATPFEIKPLKTKRGGRGMRRTIAIDEWCGEVKEKQNDQT